MRYFRKLKCKIFRKHAIFLFLIGFLYYIYPRKIKMSDLYKSWKIDIDIRVQNEIENNVHEIYGLSNMISPHDKFAKTYNFLHLAKRMRHVAFSEMTSANPDTANPLSPDFSFHLSFEKRRAKLFEDYGCGCIYRLFLLPPFSSFPDRIDSLTSDDMDSLTIMIELDGASNSYNLKEIMLADSYPFFYPLTSRNIKPMSGIGGYTQLCYVKSAKIYYIDDNNYPENILNMTVDCVSNELKCPIKQYSSISYLKMPLNQKKLISDINNKNINDLKIVATLFEDPVSNGPHSDIGCNLFCITLKPNSIMDLYNAKDYSGIITSTMLTILNMKTDEVVSDWSDIFLVAYFDDAEIPQVNVSIESLFISQGISNDFKGAAYGRVNRKCHFGLEDQYRKNDLLNVAYLYLPMPFWKNAKINLHYFPQNPDGQPKMVCYQLTESRNFYNPLTTGHLHITQIFHSGQTDKKRVVMKKDEGWGHLVGIGVEVHNLRPNLEGSLIQRWAALQADPVVYIDGLNTPKVRGTGLEDYFSYAHGFAGAVNTSYSLVGVPLAVVDRDDGNTWICYRQHLLDPIPFDESIEFLMEGTHKSHFTSKAEEISYDEFKEKLSNRETVFSYLSLFYYKSLPVLSKHKTCDKIVFCQESSILEHNFKSSYDGTLFFLNSTNFIGDVRSIQPSNITCGISFPNFAIINFRFALPKLNNPKLVLTRTFHMQPFQWNDLSQVEINGVDLGVWMFPMGPTTSRYSLRDESMEIPTSNIGKDQSLNGQAFFNFKITVLSQWHDISYELCDVR